MSDRAAVMISIGGPLKHADIETLVARAEADGAGENYDGGASAEQLEAMIEEAASAKEPVHFSHNEKSGASFDLIEAACQELGLTYARRSDAYVGCWGGVFAFWTPGMAEAREFTSDGDGGPPCLSATEIRDAMKGGTLEAELTLMEEAETFPFPLVIIEP